MPPELTSFWPVKNVMSIFEMPSAALFLAGTDTARPVIASSSHTPFWNRSGILPAANARSNFWLVPVQPAIIAARSPSKNSASTFRSTRAVQSLVRRSWNSQRVNSVTLSSGRMKACTRSVAVKR